MLQLAREGSLYPSVILHGGTDAERAEAAVELARTLLCGGVAAERPCGKCRNCLRIAWPEEGAEDRFHPDFHLLKKDLKTSTSVEAARTFLRAAQVAPFEARGQVFVIANAESLSPEAANSLLKNLEEPHVTSPRHFLLLAPSRLDLLQTLRSRSLSVFLGAAEPLEGETVRELARVIAAQLGRFAESGAAVYLLAVADTLKEGIDGWEDVRSRRPWSMAAAALVAAVKADEVPPGLIRRTLALAEALLRAPTFRMRAVSPERILEGLLAKHLAGPEPEAI